MGSKLSDLASRFKSAIADQEAEQSKSEQERDQNRIARDKERKVLAAAARKARKALLDDLAAFGTELGFVEVTQKKNKLKLVYAKHKLNFQTQGDEDRINVDYKGAAENEALYRDEADVWVWFRDGALTPLHDEGLQTLLIKALQLPEPDEAPVIPETEDADETAEEPAQSADQDAKKQSRDKGREAHLGRSGTRGYKPAKDLPPGSVVKDYKGYGPT